MRKSTLNRFQGAICGSLIALDYNQFHKPEIRLSYLGETMLWQAQSLIYSGELDLSVIENIDKITTGKMAVIILPLILYCHEDNQLLTDKLTKTLDKLNQPPDMLKELLIWAKAIALAFREKQQVQELIPQLLSTNSQTKLEQQLRQVHSYWQQNNSLRQITVKLSSLKQTEQIPLSLALYCFAVGGGDFTITVTRAGLTNYQPELTIALTGALLGVYKGYQSIPLQLRLSLQKYAKIQEATAIANKLYASWCGVTQTSLSQWLKPIQAIAAPGLIQSRSQLNIISQKNQW